MLFGALFQYMHGIFTQLAHRMHQPQAQPLGDIGFKYLPVRACMPCRGSLGRERRCWYNSTAVGPHSSTQLAASSQLLPHAHRRAWPTPTPPCRAAQELGLRNAWVSETIFWCMFIPFILWSFSPFVTARKRFYTAVLYARLLMVLVSE